MNGQRGVAFRQREPCAHQLQWLANALHGAAGERGVTYQGEFALLRRQEARYHAHGRSGVAAVKGMSARGYATGNACDIYGFSADPIDLGAQGFHARQRRGTVCARGEVGEARGSFRKSSEHRVAMADGLVPRQAKASIYVAGRADNAFDGCGVQESSREIFSLFESIERREVAFPNRRRIAQNTCMPQQCTGRN